MHLIVAWSIAILFTLTVPSANSADLVVIDSIASTLKPGDRLDGAQPLSLSAGQSLTMLSESGEMVRIEGPYSGTPTSARVENASGIVTSLSRLLQDTNKKHLRFAGFRNRPSDLWVINAEIPGTWCIHPNRKTIFHRSTAEGDALFVIEQVGAGESTHQSTHVWQHNAHHLNWPDEITRKSGAEFVAYVNGTSEPDRFHLFITPDNLPSEAHLAAWMADRGCTRQAIKSVNIIATRGR